MHCRKLPLSKLLHILSKLIQHMTTLQPRPYSERTLASNNPTRITNCHEEICVTDLSHHTARLKLSFPFNCSRIWTTNLQTSYHFFFKDLCSRSISSPFDEVEVVVAFTVTRTAAVVVPCVVSMWPWWLCLRWGRGCCRICIFILVLIWWFFLCLVSMA